MPFGYGTCFEQLDIAQHPFGRGAGQRPLIPFKSVAVDPTVIAIGEPLYIPEFDGLSLPDGSIHDGCVRADDTGGGIKKRKMDFFVVTYGNFRFLLDQLLGPSWITPHVEAPRCEYLRDSALSRRVDTWSVPPMLDGLFVTPAVTHPRVTAITEALASAGAEGKLVVVGNAKLATALLPSKHDGDPPCLLSPRRPGRSPTLSTIPPRSRPARACRDLRGARSAKPTARSS